MKKSYRYALLAVAIILASNWLYAFFIPVVSDEKGVVYYLKPGTSTQAMISELSQQGVIPSSILFSVYAYPHFKRHLKTGEYFFPKGSTEASIWRQVTKGTGFYYYHFTIVPGWTFLQLREALAQAPNLRLITTQLSDQQIMERLGAQDVAPEGEFFAETYYYTRGMQDLVILKRAYDLMQTSLNEAWDGRAKDLPYKDMYQALIAASLVEKEAYLNSERPIIAGVLVNRLRKDMLLQFDPTVIYGLGARYNGKIYKKDLLEDTAYNTYIHKNLPPTPIAIPSLSSIEAALHPQQHDYLYFVGRGDKSHQFSKTLPEHNAAVAAVAGSEKK